MATTRSLYHFTDHFRRPKDSCTWFLKSECQLLGAYIISLTIFGGPIVVLGFLFSLLFITMGAVFCQRPVLTLILEKVSGNSMIRLKFIELLLHLWIEGYIPVWHSMIYDNVNVVQFRIYLILG